jgi:hypothetical protein
MAVSKPAPLLCLCTTDLQSRWTTCWIIRILGSYFRRGLKIFLFTTASRTDLWPTQPPIQWVPEALSLGAKRPGREADHSPPSSAEAKECVELHLHSPSTPSWRGDQLKHRDSFTFYLTTHLLCRIQYVSQRSCCLVETFSFHCTITVTKKVFCVVRVSACVR